VQLLASQIPESVAKSISPGEYNDRLVEAARLSAQAADPALSTDLRQAAKIRAQAVLRAQPRAATRQQHAAMIAKAAATPNQWQAAAIRRHAERLIEEEHPIAPGRAGAVRKAKADADDTPVPVFDADGNLIGIVDPDKITPVAGAGKKADPAQAAAPAEPAGQPAAPVPADGQVAKSAQTVVYDQWRRPYLTSWRHVTRVVAKAAPAQVTYRDRGDGTADCYDAAGRLIGTFSPQGGFVPVASPGAQASSTGPVNAGGTTGMGRPRQTGPAAALPADGPQQQLPGDVPGRTVVKGAGWTDVHDAKGNVVGIVKSADVTRGSAAELDRRLPVGSSRRRNIVYVHDARGRLTGFAARTSVLPVRRGRGA
jgi:hypothetical protein